MNSHKKLFLSILVLLAASLPLCAQRNAWQPSEHYTDMVATFENRGDIGTSTIVMLGNSLTEFGGDWSVRLGTHDVANYGIMGDNAQGIGNRLRQITPHHPKAIFLMVGINDVTAVETDKAIFARCRAVIEQIREQSPQTRLFVQSLLPINLNVKCWKKLAGQEQKIVDLNRRIARYCKRKHLTFIDLYPLFTAEDGRTLREELTTDGLHINDSGYQIWSEALRNYLQQIATTATPAGI